MSLDLKQLLQYEEDRADLEKSQSINLSLFNSDRGGENKNLLKM